VARRRSSAATRPQGRPAGRRYGEIDELNAWLGLARASRLDPALDPELVALQPICSLLAPNLPDPADKLARA